MHLHITELQDVLVSIWSKQNIWNLTQLLVTWNGSIVLSGHDRCSRGRVAVSELSEVFSWSPICIAQLNLQCQVPGLLQVKELSIITEKSWIGFNACISTEKWNTLILKLTGEHMWCTLDFALQSSLLLVMMTDLHCGLPVIK